MHLRKQPRLTVIGLTKEVDSMTDKDLEDAKIFSGKNAGICYMKDSYFDSDVSDDVKAVKVTSTFSFIWGTAFGGQNPGKLDPNAENTVHGPKNNVQVLKDFVSLIGTDSAKNLLTVKVTPLAVAAQS